jgi:hypothetical protein
MNDANAIPSAGLAIVAITVAVIFGLAVLLSLLVQFVVNARDELRERYVGGRWSPRSVDLLGVPIWAGLEVVCLLGGIVLAVLTVVAIYSLARDFRDWWHDGDRER